MIIVDGALDDRPGGDKKPVKVCCEQNLHRDLMKAKKRNSKNFDSVIGADAACGGGKSQFVICTVAPILANKMSDIHITFDINEFEDVCFTNKSKPLDVVIFDESHSSMNTAQTQSTDFQRLVNLLMLIRKKRLYIIIVTQCFFELSKSIAIFRMNLLYHIYEKNDQRGFFLAFGRSEKKNLYILGKKFLNYGAVRCNYVGEFRKNQHLMPLDYEDRKDQHIINQNKKLKAGTPKRLDVALRIMDKTILNLVKLNFKYHAIAEIMGLGDQTIRDHWTKMKKRGLVPDKYLILYKNRKWKPILPTDLTDVTENIGLSCGSSYNNTPDNNHDTGCDTKGGERNDRIAPILSKFEGLDKNIKIKEDKNYE